MSWQESYWLLGSEFNWCTLSSINKYSEGTQLGLDSWAAWGGCFAVLLLSFQVEGSKGKWNAKFACWVKNWDKVLQLLLVFLNWTVLIIYADCCELTPVTHPQLSTTKTSKPKSKLSQNQYKTQHSFFPMVIMISLNSFSDFLLFFKSMYLVCKAIKPAALNIILTLWTL